MSSINIVEWFKVWKVLSSKSLFDRKVMMWSLFIISTSIQIIKHKSEVIRYIWRSTQDILSVQIYKNNKPVLNYIERLTLNKGLNFILF